MEKIYNPKQIENKWYKFWEASGFFNSCIDDSKKPFVIVIPPPNVTGALHIGHALNNTLQDVIIRYKRMKGYNALWVPGTDHGGIATQNVVEKMLLQEGIKRQDLGREKLLEKIWEWKNKAGNRIIEQLKLLGCSCDWRRTVFTMDERYYKSVLEAFVRLYNAGLIYRGKRIVNWCVRCQTALADIEVEHKELQGKLWYIKYPFKDSSGFITVATTRPETMLGDTAVAVNPEDKRYKELVGKVVILPLMNREIKIVEDNVVDIEFGTGAVKVTPAHDPVDFEIAKRKNLDFVFVIGYDGKMTTEAKQYVGLDRYECREKVVDDLKKLNLLEKIESYNYSVGTCYRCNTVIEPIISEQWFLSVKEISERAIDAVESEDVKFYPKMWKEHCVNWLKNLKDWCISRQIYWGHRIPVYYCENNCKPFASVDEPENCPSCGSKNIKQDEDVLDTWFSSALWPFGVFNWPYDNKDLNYYYPTGVLVTGYEILYFWVARMIQMGLYFMKNVPFRDVYIHGIVRDVHGRKMSKSLGNIIDPIEVIDEYGADALRFSLVESAGAGKDIHLSYDSFKSARNLTNKIWNAARYVLDATKDLEELNFQRYSFVDKWILIELKELLRKIDVLYMNYQLDDVSRALYDFFWKKFCDWYIELSKVNIREFPEYSVTTQSVLLKVFEIILRLFHPLMPFITEELWQLLKVKANIDTPSIMLVTYPDESEIEDFSDKNDVIKNVNYLFGLIDGIRSVRGELKIDPKKQLKIYVYADERSVTDKIKNWLPYLSFICKVFDIEPLEALKIPSYSIPIPISDLHAFVPIEGVVDINKEKQKLQDEISELELMTLKLKSILQDTNFLSKASEYEIEEKKQKLEQFLLKKQRLEKILSSM